MNNAGQVVGWAHNAAGQQRAVIWSGPWQDLAVNFGPGAGVWALRQTSWTQVHGLSPELMASGDLDGNGLDDLVLDFGPDVGVWVWMNHGTWMFLNSVSPTHMVTADLDNSGRDEVVFDFPGWRAVCLAEQHVVGAAAPVSAPDTWLPRTSMARPARS